MEHQKRIESILSESAEVKSRILKDQALLERIHNAVEKVIHLYKNDGKLLLCGNGGSAGDAQHIAAEFTGRFYYDRPPLNAEALHVNSSYLTAVGNDYGYDEIYARMVKAQGKENDILIGISTSGNSPNVLKAINAAKELGMITIGMTGESGGKMSGLVDVLINVPSNDTPRIQESHITIGHIICELVESSIFPK
ncbi:MAG: D-sedoheptulose 7-phosphate isomerase [Crocinitomicaceae bacterium]|nr:D-sedoheptulose 7-phosphate isomerase [Crocinitomicaceae bacterium]